MCAKCDALAEEVAYLRSELGLRMDAAELDALRQAFRLSKNEARVALLLARANGRPVPKTQIEEAMPARDAEERCASLVSSVMRNVRRKVGKGSIPNVWGVGYRMSPEALRAVAAVL